MILLLPKSYNRPHLLRSGILVFGAFLTLVLCCCGSSAEQADAASDGQDQTSDIKPKSDGPLPDILDTICLSYRFTVGDSILYEAQSYDSIMAHGTPPLLKARRESYSLVCDSLDEQGLYYLRWTLEASTGVQAQGTEHNVERTSSPWERRTVYICMDSLGRRKLVLLTDTTAAMGPGGPFQPAFFVDLGESCKGTDESWLTPRKLDTLHENGFPAPLLASQKKFRIKGKVDSLGQPCVRVEYVLSGQGSSITPHTHTQLLTTSVTTGFGSTVFRTTDMLPIGLFRTSENKLTVKTPDGHESSLVHMISSDLRIREHFRHGRSIEVFDPARN